MRAKPKKPDIKAMTERAGYSYLRNIKRWMFCPSCRDGRLHVNKKRGLWICNDCDYELPIKEFEDDYIFWFCDECDAYLNTQDGFDRAAPKHKCTKCGFTNDTTEDNAPLVCSVCGKKLATGEKRLCEGCSTRRNEKAAKGIGIAAAVVGAAVAVMGAIAKTGSDENSSDEEKELFGKVTSSWLDSASEDELRQTDDEMVAFLEAHDWDDSDECSEVYDKHNDNVNAIASRFPLNLPKREHGWYLENDD